MKSIFISSTFRDMQAERDLVQEKVLPELRAEAKKYGDTVSVIDLRWGIDTSSLENDEGSAKVLTVCLDEIDRSHPYMLIFLGERYGWIPDGKLIEKAVRDRGDKYVTEDFHKSVTALEIEYGALSEAYGDLSRCIICFREPVTTVMDEETKAIYAEQEESGKQKLCQLKERIRRELGSDDRLITYTCSWDEAGRELRDFKVGEEPLEKVLIKEYIEMFRDDWKAYEALCWQEKEQIAFRSITEQKLRSFVGREELLENYYQKIVNGTNPLIIQGKSGSGKTAVMCKLIERLQKEGKRVFPFFSNGGELSTSADLLVRQMVYWLETVLGIEEHFVSETKIFDDEKDIDIIKNLQCMAYDSLENKPYYKYLNRLYELCDMLQEKVFFCMDALDKLYFDGHMERLDFLIKHANVQMVVSCSDEFDMNQITIMGMEREYIPELRKEEIREVIKGLLKAECRDSYEELEREILKKKSSGSPLYVSMLIQRLNMMDQEELEKVNTGEEIALHSVNVIRNMPDDIEEAAVTILSNAIDKVGGDNSGLLWESMDYIAVSRAGLSMDLLKDLVGKYEVRHGMANPRNINWLRKTGLSELDFSILMKYLDVFFFVGERKFINFAYDMIRKGLLKRGVDVKYYAEILKKYGRGFRGVMDAQAIGDELYFSRLTEDYWHGRIILSNIEKYMNPILSDVVRREALEDEGEFYCKVILQPNIRFKDNPKIQRADHISWVETVAQRWLLGLFGHSHKELKVRKNIAKTLVSFFEEVYAEEKTSGNLESLYGSYLNLGCVLDELGDYEEAYSSFEKALHCIEGEEWLYSRTVCYNRMGEELEKVGRYDDAFVLYEKVLKCRVELYEQQKSEEALYDLSFSYSKMGSVLYGMGRYEESAEYHRRAIEYREELYEKQKNEENLRALSVSYNNFGDALRGQKQYEEALVYYERNLHIRETLHEARKNTESLTDLAFSYYNMGRTLRGLERYEEALLYQEKEIACKEALHSEKKTAFTLQRLARGYNAMGLLLKKMKKYDEAFAFYEKALCCMKEQYELKKDAASLQELSDVYFSISELFGEKGCIEDTLAYYEKYLEGVEELYTIQKKEEDLEILSDGYNEIGIQLHKRKDYEKALFYYKKSLNYRKELYQKNPVEKNMRELSVGYSNIGYVLCDMKQYEEGLEYAETALKYTEEIDRTNLSPKTLSAMSRNWSIISKALKDLGREEEAAEYRRKTVEVRRELFRQAPSDDTKRRLRNALSEYAKACIAVEEYAKGEESYREALVYSKELCDKEDSIANFRVYIKMMKGLGDCLLKIGKTSEAGEYLGVAVKEAEQLYSRSGNEAEKKLLEELRSEMS